MAAWLYIKLTAGSSIEQIHLNIIKNDKRCYIELCIRAVTIYSVPSHRHSATHITICANKTNVSQSIRNPGNIRHLHESLKPSAEWHAERIHSLRAMNAIPEPKSLHDLSIASLLIKCRHLAGWVDSTNFQIRRLGGTDYRMDEFRTQLLALQIRNMDKTQYKKWEPKFKEEVQIIQWKYKVNVSMQYLSYGKDWKY